MTETARRFFGYGSLVNCATHDHGFARRARLRGWRRHWVQAADRPLAFLSVRPDPLSAIDGLVCDVAPGGWPALDLRETAYFRTEVSPDTLAPTLSNVMIYQAEAPMPGLPDQTRPMLLSYLDVVVQGFLNEFGEDGVMAFMRSTTGWDVPMVDDRAAPIYPRAQVLSAAETALVDTWVAQLGVRFVPRESVPDL